jgi:alginate O-acetyltransferase complex protein AlgI
MVFSSPIFLLLFLPVTLAAYALARGRGKTLVLLAASGVFYLWGEGRFIALLLSSVLMNWAFGRLIADGGEARQRRVWLALAVAVNLVALAYFKYTAFALANVNELAAAIGLSPVAVGALPLPLGISFFTFHAISYVVDVYRRNASAEPRLSVFALYIMLFPQLIAGPIIRWKDIAGQLTRREERLADFAYGVRRFVLGLGKKDYPYVARSVREFWRRWHISLSNWFRDYLYIPLGGNRRGTLRGYVNLVIVFMLCGLWHGASWSFVLWGAWHGLFLVAERAGLERVLTRIGALRHVYALAAIAGGWVLFRCDTLSHAAGYYRALLGFAAGDPMLHPVSQLLNGLVACTLLVAVFGSTPLARMLGEWRHRSGAARASGVMILTLDTTWLAVVFIAAAAFLASGTYNPFIYFRF